MRKLILAAVLGLIGFGPVAIEASPAKAAEIIVVGNGYRHHRHHNRVYVVQPRHYYRHHYRNRYYGNRYYGRYYGRHHYYGRHFYGRHSEYRTHGGLVISSGNSYRHHHHRRYHHY